MRTWTGSEAPLNGTGSVNLLDLVIHCGRELRWGGFGSPEYTVLHHTALVTMLWLRGGFPRDEVAYIFAHDLHESYTGDIPSPLKRFIGDGLKTLEAQLDARIYEALKLPPPSAEVLRRVKICDLAALVIEAPLFGPPLAAGGDRTNPAPNHLSESQARNPFYHPDVPKEFATEVAQLLLETIPDLHSVLRRRGLDSFSEMP